MCLHVFTLNQDNWCLPFKKIEMKILYHLQMGFSLKANNIVPLMILELLLNDASGL